MRTFEGAGGVEISYQDVLKMIDKLKSKLDKDIVLSALTVGGMLLRNATRDRLIKKLPKASTARGKEKDSTMIEGVRVSKNEKGGFVNVFILGNYLNSWFELGTDDRYLIRGHQFKKKEITRTGKYRQFKKKEYRGRIKPLHFFRETQESEMAAVMDKIKEVVENKLKKLTDE